jgi:hypothetical protein
MIPGVMTVLAFGNENILSSSQKGGNSFSYEYGDTKVLKTIQLCQVASNEDGKPNKLHKNHGKCGEVFVSHMYYSLYDTSLAKQNARVATVTFNKGAGIPQQTDPCGE